MSNYQYNKGKGKGNGKQPKKSGCKFRSASQNRNNADCITAWNNSKSRGFITLIACPVRDSLIVANERGYEYEKWVVTIKFKRDFSEKTFTGFFDPATKKLRIPDIQMTASPNASNGGFFGGWSKK
jgi:hypothetical protein